MTVHYDETSVVVRVLRCVECDAAIVKVPDGEDFDGRVVAAATLEHNLREHGHD